MYIEFVGKNYDVSDKFKTIADSKLARLDKFFRDDATARIVITLTKHTYKTELTINFGGRILRAEEISESPFDSIDKLIPKIEGQIRKHRTQLANRLHDDAPAEDDEKPNRKQVVKSKTYYLTPMSDQDAIAELEMLDEGFYIYLDESTCKVKVVYMRSDGNVGIIDCKY